MTPEDIRTIGSFLDSFGTMTLATHGPVGPWAASLFFARDEQLNLYFISSMHSNHVKELLAADTVAVTVNADHKEWKDIRGLQIFGTAQHLEQDERSEAEGLYLQKFENMRHVLSAPSTAAERKISEKFLASDFFCIRPKMIRIIDNTKGFGHTEEFIVGGPPVGD